MSNQQKTGLIILIAGIILAIIGLVGIKKTNGSVYHWTLALGLIAIGSGATLLIMKSGVRLIVQN